MYSYLTFRSLTEAHRGLEVLHGQRIPASLVRRSSGAGCGYGIRLRTQYLDRAHAVLSNAGIPLGGVSGQ